MYTLRAITGRWAIGLGVLALLLPAGASASDAEMQALFISKVALYVEWPADAFASPDAPVVIGILEDVPFADELASIVVDETVKNRALEVRRLASAAEAEGCHIVVLGSERRSALRRVARDLRGKSILTVAASRDFAKDGGMLSMEMYRGKVAFEVNYRTAKQSDIKISDRLLKLASNVH
jgi:hypothetical protein